MSDAYRSRPAAIGHPGPVTPAAPPCSFLDMDPFPEDPALWPKFRCQLVAVLAEFVLVELQSDLYRVALGVEHDIAVHLRGDVHDRVRLKRLQP